MLYDTPVAHLEAVAPGSPQRRLYVDELTAEHGDNGRAVCDNTGEQYVTTQQNSTFYHKAVYLKDYVDVLFSTV